MFIVGDNLRELVQKYKIIDDLRDVEETCIELRLYKIIKKLIPTEKTNVLRYGEAIPKECVQIAEIPEEGLVIEPLGTVLACSNQRVIIPQGYMGIVQTKGSLARMFIFSQCSDFQVDSGFKGRVTLELYNASQFSVLLREGQKVANLYILPVSDKNVRMYQGKYNGADEPTIQLP
ncbi:MAG: hypothetical protein NC420_08940 [Eubacterium sp.]|nr:hypothetical protein [Eubacterium sp.]MCM1218607.1 hypothetical protein [Lachnospiraceae bacterium]MCM1303875.1 hypothetical protein [Butyrivibrio sp.]MCM1344850.1 hypothetical protein [Muribaculaceae bacterium]MCM1241178.1 hypothetical protein [Lachnospiraceae bacterium]